jgi:hypothetical protein
VTYTNVLQLSQPVIFSDPLTEVLRSGARALLAQAVEAEVAALLRAHAEELTADGRQRLVRHGYLLEREIMTGIGPVAVRCPRVRDRGAEGSGRIRLENLIWASTINIAVLYVFGMIPLTGIERSFTITDFWRWWVVHLWVEQSFEFFAASMSAYFLWQSALSHESWPNARFILN